MIKTALGVITGCSTSIVAYEYFKHQKSRYAVAEEKKNSEIVNVATTQPKNSAKEKFEKKKKRKKEKMTKKQQIGSNITFDKKYQNLVPRLLAVIKRVKEESGSPGIVFAITHNGDLVMKGGLGLADVENVVPCNELTSMRIASISKSLTSVAAGKLIQDGLLDINLPVYSYLKDMPVKTFDGEPVTITTKQLLSHTSGIRGYFRDPAKYDVKKASSDSKMQLKHQIQLEKFGKECSKKVWNENYIMKHYKTVELGLQLFQNDPLIYKPGTDFEYTSLAYSLVSRIIEVTSGKDYIKYLNEICYGMGMMDTHVDLNKSIVANRSRNYDRRRRDHKLLNSPYVDNSYKWSGGGFLSTANDITKLGNNMLRSYSTRTGYLQPETIQLLWQPLASSLGKYRKHYNYALGWAVQEKTVNKPFAIHHTGAAIGASSVLLVIPEKQIVDPVSVTSYDEKPRGTVITLIVNMQSVGLLSTAEKLAEMLQ